MWSKNGGDSKQKWLWVGSKMWILLAVASHGFHYQNPLRGKVKRLQVMLVGFEPLLCWWIDVDKSASWWINLSFGWFPHSCWLKSAFERMKSQSLSPKSWLTPDFWRNSILSDFQNVFTFAKIHPSFALSPCSIWTVGLYFAGSRSALGLCFRAIHDTVARRCDWMVTNKCYDKYDMDSDHMKHHFFKHIRSST